MVNARPSQKVTIWPSHLLLRGSRLQQPDDLIARPSNFLVVRSQSRSAARLKICFGAGSPGGCRIGTFFKGVIGQSTVSVTPSTTVRGGGNVVGGLHDICVGGERTNLESGRAGSCAGVARTS